MVDVTILLYLPLNTSLDDLSFLANWAQTILMSSEEKMILNGKNTRYFRQRVVPKLYNTKNIQQKDYVEALKEAVLFTYPKKAIEGFFEEEEESEEEPVVEDSYPLADDKDIENELSTEEDLDLDNDFDNIKRKYQVIPHSSFRGKSKEEIKQSFQQISSKSNETNSKFSRASELSYLPNYSNDNDIVSQLDIHSSSHRDRHPKTSNTNKIATYQFTHKLNLTNLPEHVCSANKHVILSIASGYDRDNLREVRRIINESGVALISIGIGDRGMIGVGGYYIRRLSQISELDEKVVNRLWSLV